MNRKFDEGQWLTWNNYSISFYIQYMQITRVDWRTSWHPTLLLQALHNTEGPVGDQSRCHDDHLEPSLPHLVRRLPARGPWPDAWQVSPWQLLRLPLVPWPAGGRGRNALAELGCVFSNRRHARSFCQSVVPGFLVFESCLAKWLRGVINHNSRVRSQWGRDEIHAEMLIYHAIITSAAKNWGRTKAPLGHRGRCRLLPWPWRRSGELFVGRGDLFLWIHMDYMVIYQLCPNWCELLLKYHSHRGSIPTYGSYSTLFVPPYDLHRGCTHSEYPPVSSNMEVENPL